MPRLLFFVLFTLFLSPIVFVPVSFAVEPDEVLADPVLESRAREISRNVRCVVCQNEPIDSSNADIARELRLIVRERLVAGDSDEQIESFLVARYGDYVLFRPPLNAQTLFLWFGPFVVLILGAIVLFFCLRTHHKKTAPLTAEEQSELERLLSPKTESDTKPNEEPGA